MNSLEGKGMFFFFLYFSFLKEENVCIDHVELSVKRGDFVMMLPIDVLAPNGKIFSNIRILRKFCSAIVENELVKFRRFRFLPLLLLIFKIRFSLLIIAITFW